MTKPLTEIEVSAVYDGELDATEVFVSLIKEKYGGKAKSPIVTLEKVPYNEDEAQENPFPSGLCG